MLGKCEICGYEGALQEFVDGIEVGLSGLNEPELYVFKCPECGEEFIIEV